MTHLGGKVHMAVQIEEENEIRRHFIISLAMNSSTVLLNRSSFYSQAIRSPSHLPESSLCHTMLFPGVSTYKVIRGEAPHTDGQLALEGDLDQPSLIQSFLSP